ncbi:MAG TPA: TIGR03618 family F420-dependent PPOX class oxidoreductase [Candidatus Acidoferrum sp.]|nr:TIGR03618 family F420-dependent PPOX class oxidoreductase [Candidatus Acidoferrum sp.]
MTLKPLDPALQQFLQGRRIATLATSNPDGTIHLTAVWYLLDAGSLFVATSSKTRKARNIAARPRASLMIDSRNPGVERGITISGEAELIAGPLSKEINRRLHSRYLSASALSDPAVGPVFESFDDVTIRLAPAGWFGWDMAALDAMAFGGRLGNTPGYMLPLD